MVKSDTYAHYDIASLSHHPTATYLTKFRAKGLDALLHRDRGGRAGVFHGGLPGGLAPAGVGGDRRTPPPPPPRQRPPPYPELCNSGIERIGKRIGLTWLYFSAEIFPNLRSTGNV